MGKRLFSGKVSSLPDNLRCRRSDGRQWRCPQPAKSGLSFCEYHYQQVRRNQDNIKNTNVVAAAAAEPERRLLFTADPPLSKKRRRRRIRKDPAAAAAAPISSVKMDEGDLQRKSSDLKLNGNLSLPDKFQHHQFDGREGQCSQLSMPFISFGGRRLRCKQPNEEKNKVIERKPKRSPCLVADVTPSINRRRRRRLKGGTRAEESMKISEREEGTCDMEAAEPAVTRDLPIPDTLRCRRSDGRKWRCTQPAIAGLGFCEHHQMRCKQSNNKNTMVKVAKSDRGFQFPVNPRRSTKQMKRRQMREQPAGDLMRMEQNKQGLKAAELATSELSLDDKLLCCKEDNSKNGEAEQREKEAQTTEYSTSEEMEAVEPATPGLNLCDNEQQCCREDNNRYKEAATKPNCRLHFAGDPQPSMKDLSLPDHLRCRRSDGRKWRCPQLCMPSVGFCEYHYLQVRRNQGKRKNSKLASGAKRKRQLRLAANQSLARKLRPQRLKWELPGEEQMRTTQKEERDEGMEATNVEVTRDLPNGVMAISPAPVSVPANASPWLHWKIGSDGGYLFERRFRSKNAELVPLVKKLPFSRSVVGRRKKVCHRCRARENKDERRICCSNCQEFFCSICIETWHSELSELELRMSCPVCRGCCTCINCNSRSDEDETSNSSKQVRHKVL